MFISLSRELFETTTFNIKPQVHFISSSVGEFPATGSAYVAPVRSKCIRDIVKDFEKANLEISAGAFDIVDYVAINILDTVNNSIRENYDVFTGSGMDIYNYLDIYMSASNDSPKNIRFDKFLDMYRFDPPLKFNMCHVIKRNLNNILYPYYQHHYPESGIHYTNYNCLNFYTASNVPADSCLMYPNKDDVYTPREGFSLDFWVNPRYDNGIPGTEYHAGTIFHMSSSIAVSLVSGSLRDEHNLVDDFKILLQLSHSADINPKRINTGDINALSDLIFTSSFNLRKNHWHHVTINWEPSANNSTGSIRVDGDSARNINYFHIPSSSLSTENNSVICVGNYLDANVDEAQKFFNTSVSSKQGLTQLNGLAAEPEDQSTILRNRLNAEIHDVKLFDRALSSDEVVQITRSGINQKILSKDGCEISDSSLYDRLLFYVPPFFYPETPDREVLLTPFQTSPETLSTDDPINVQFSFGVGGKMINLENFVREFKQGNYPRLQALTASTIDFTIEDITADEYVYNSGSILMRNFTIMPCDNGLFFPDYYPISISDQSGSDSYVKSGDSYYDFSRINLDNLIPSSSLYPGLVFQGGTIFDAIVGASPENPGVAPGSVLTIAQRTRDRTSNETAIFDISNLYYGNKITEESFEMFDNNLTGSQGRIKVRIRDNGQGSLYRADSKTPHAKWNNVGDLFYHEGMAVIKTPHLPYYCKDRTDIKLKGDQNVHTLILNVPCSKGIINSSSNKNYVAQPPTKNVSDRDLSTVYVSSVNIHDDNFNIIMRANFSQPIPKTEEDEFVIRLKQDF